MRLTIRPWAFAISAKTPPQPEDLFSVEFQLYVKQGLSRRRIGTALWQLMREMMEMGNRRRVLCRVDRDNQAALDFFTAMGFVPLAGDPPEEPEKAWLVWSAGSLGPPGRKAHQAVLGGGGRLRSRQGAGGRLGGVSQGFKRWKPVANAAGFLLFGNGEPMGGGEKKGLKKL